MHCRANAALLGHPMRRFANKSDLPVVSALTLNANPCPPGCPPGHSLQRWMHDILAMLGMARTSRSRAKHATRLGSTVCSKLGPRPDHCFGTPGEPRRLMRMAQAIVLRTMLTAPALAGTLAFTRFENGTLACKRRHEAGPGDEQQRQRSPQATGPRGRAPDAVKVGLHASINHPLTGFAASIFMLV